MRVLARRKRASAWVRCLVHRCVLVVGLLLASAIFAQPEPESPAETPSATPAGEPEPESGIEPDEELAPEMGEPSDLTVRLVDAANCTSSYR